MSGTACSAPLSSRTRATSASLASAPAGATLTTTPVPFSPSSLGGTSTRCVMDGVSGTFPSTDPPRTRSPAATDGVKSHCRGGSPSLAPRLR